jgi:hypothetical protein
MGNLCVRYFNTIDPSTSIEIRSRSAGDNKLPSLNPCFTISGKVPLFSEGGGRGYFQVEERFLLYELSGSNLLLPGGSLVQFPPTNGFYNPPETITSVPLGVDCRTRDKTQQHDEWERHEW